MYSAFPSSMESMHETAVMEVKTLADAGEMAVHLELVGLVSQSTVEITVVLTCASKTVRISAGELTVMRTDLTKPPASVEFSLAKDRDSMFGRRRFEAAEQRSSEVVR